MPNVTSVWAKWSQALKRLEGCVTMCLTCRPWSNKSWLLAPSRRERSSQDESLLWRLQEALCHFYSEKIGWVFAKSPCFSARRKLYVQLRVSFCQPTVICNKEVNAEQWRNMDLVFFLTISFRAWSRTSLVMLTLTLVDFQQRLYCTNKSWMKARYANACN